MRRSRGSASTSSNSLRLNRAFFLLLLAGVTLLVFFVARFFLVVLLLSALSAGIFHPVHLRLRQRLPRPRWLSATISTVVFCLIILIPAGVLGYFTVSNLIDIANQAVGHNRELLARLRHFESALGTLPLFESGPLKNVLTSDRLAQLLQNAASWMLRQVTGLVENVVRSILMLFVYLYSLYFFIKDGEPILRGIGDALPLPEEDRLAVERKFLAVTRATLKSTFIIGGTQGVVGGLLYWAVGIQGPVLWGILIMIFASIPGVGSIVIWLPTAAVLLLLGQYGKAAVILAVGAAGIPLAELLRPYLIGGDTRIHPVLVLVGVLGGIWVFGIVGLLLGPLIMGVAVTLWDIFRRMFAQELETIGDGKGD
jgi:predicted PurR-regulated permease PerM